jgi:hypothetical protein
MSNDNDNEYSNNESGKQKRTIFEVRKAYFVAKSYYVMTRNKFWTAFQQIPKDLPTLHAHVDEWSLADDAGLLHVLEEFSTRLKSEMRLVERSLDELVFDTKTCHVSLRNTYSAFSMLSNKQVVLRASGGFL